MKQLLKKLLPPFMFDLYYLISQRKYGFRGDYSSWSHAQALCEGYGGSHLFERVKSAALSVKAERYFCERDSVLFETPQYAWSNLACLMSVAAREKGRLSVLDFGGSMGSSYFTNRRFLTGIDCEWSVIEQAHFVEFGAETIADDRLAFYANIESCLQYRAPNVIVLGGVLQYLPEPWVWLDRFLALDIPYIIIDRTPINKIGRDVLKIQSVDPSIYRASYPAWTFDEVRLLESCSRFGYRLVEEFDSLCDAGLNSPDCHLKGYFLKKH